MVISTDLKAAYRTPRDYELLAQAVYQGILSEAGVENVVVEHNVLVRGRSGVQHQCDVYWQFRQAGILHAVAIECKNYDSSVTIGRVRDFFGVLHDLGSTRGTIVTRKGFQRGAKAFADYYNIDLKLLRPPADGDWEGRIRNVRTKVRLRWMRSTPSCPVNVEFVLAVSSAAEVDQLEGLNAQGQLETESGAEACLYSADGNPATQVFATWLPEQIPILSTAGAGPFVHDIDVKGLYARIMIAGHPQLIPIETLKVTYFVDEFDSEDIVAVGEEIVLAVLQDVKTGQLERFHKP